MQIWAPQPPPHATSQHCKHGKHGTAGVPPEDDTIRATGVRLHAEMHVESRMGFLVIKLDGRLDQSSRGGGGRMASPPLPSSPPSSAPPPEHVAALAPGTRARGRARGQARGQRKASVRQSCTPALRASLRAVPACGPWRQEHGHEAPRMLAVPCCARSPLVALSRLWPA